MPSKPSFVDSIVAEIIQRARTQATQVAPARRELQRSMRRAGLTRDKHAALREAHRAEARTLAHQLRALGIPCNTAPTGWIRDKHGTVILMSLSKKNARRIIAALRGSDHRG